MKPRPYSIYLLWILYVAFVLGLFEMSRRAKELPGASYDPLCDCNRSAR